MGKASLNTMVRESVDVIDVIGAVGLTEFAKAARWVPC